LQVYLAVYFATAVSAQLTAGPVGPVLPENNCSTSCWARGGECFWKSPGSGLTAVSLCRTGAWLQYLQYPWQGEYCYCGRCYLCDRDPSCRGLCALRSPGPDYRVTGTCNPDTTQQKCLCWEKEVEDPCPELDPVCEWLEGECNTTKPGDNYEPTGYYCSPQDTSSDSKCPCWRERRPCGPDDVCEGLLGGQCSTVSPGSPWRQSGYTCNKEPGCHCWLYDCKAQEDRTCREKYKGVCGTASPGPDYQMTGHWCNKTQGCHCWALRDCADPEEMRTCREEYGGVCAREKPAGNYQDTGYMCNKTTGCTCWAGECDKSDKRCVKEMKGVCDVTRPKPGYVPTDYYCNKDEFCNCWIKCSNKKCEKYGGVCSVQQPQGYLRSKLWCDKKTECSCWGEACQPGSVSRSCDGGAGRCYPPGSIIPTNMERDGWCDKLKTCECWKEIGTECEPGSTSSKCPGGKCWPPATAPTPPPSWYRDGWCREDTCQCWRECPQTKQCKKKGGSCQSKPSTDTGLTLIPGKKLCKKPCVCVENIVQTDGLDDYE